MYMVILFNVPTGVSEGLETKSQTFELNFRKEKACSIFFILACLHSSFSQNSFHAWSFRLHDDLSPLWITASKINS